MAETSPWVIGIGITVIGAAIVAGSGAVVKMGADIQSLQARIDGIEAERALLRSRFEKTRDQVNKGRVERARLQEQIKACK